MFSLLLGVENSQKIFARLRFCFEGKVKKVRVAQGGPTLLWGKVLKCFCIRSCILTRIVRHRPGPGKNPHVSEKGPISGGGKNYPQSILSRGDGDAFITG